MLVSADRTLRLPTCSISQHLIGIGGIGSVVVFDILRIFPTFGPLVLIDFLPNVGIEPL